jgi:HK97 family phage major capsid protein
VSGKQYPKAGSRDGGSTFTVNPYDLIVSKQSELTSLLAKIAGENRGPNAEEKTQLDALKADVDRIKTEWESVGRQKFLESLSNSRVDAGPVILKANEKFADAVKGSYPAEQDGLSLGRLLRGYINGDWSNAELEMKAMASSPTTAGGILIPAPLSARVIDRARNLAAVLRSGAVVVPMDTATLKMARLTTDPTAAWTAEAGAIAASDAVFDSVTFTARKLAALLVINNELLDDGQNVDGVIEQAIAQACAQKLDYTALLGSGTPPEPAGIVNQSNILTETAVGTPADYDKFLSALYKVKAANFEPNAVIYAPRTAQKLATLKSGITNDKTPLVMPADWAAISKYTSAQVPITAGTGAQSYAFVGQWNQLAIGIRKQLTIEVAREGAYDISGTVYSAFQKDQTLIRAILRADVQLFHPAAFCLMSAIDA